MKFLRAWVTARNLPQLHSAPYTDERMSSTAVIAFLFIPPYAVPYTLGGATAGLLFAFLLATILRRPFTRKGTQPLPMHQA